MGSGSSSTGKSAARRRSFCAGSEGLLKGGHRWGPTRPVGKGRFIGRNRLGKIPQRKERISEEQFCLGPNRPGSEAGPQDSLGIVGTAAHEERRGQVATDAVV